MEDAWLNFDDLKKEWLKSGVFAKAMLPLKHTVRSYVQDHFVAAFLVPESRVKVVRESTSASWHDLHSPRPLLADGYKHFLSLSIRRSAGLRLSGWHTYVDERGKVVAERKTSSSSYVEESGIFISRPVLLSYAARMRLRLGFLVDSVRYTERELPEVGAVDEKFGLPHAFFRMLRQDQHVVGGPRMKVRSIFVGKTFA